MRKLTIMLVVVVLAALALWLGSQVVPLRAGSYNRISAVTHADAYALSRAPDYPNYGTGTGCTDCTNYVSQVLHKGGLPELKGDDDIWHWYYYWHWWHGWRGSRTWAATDWLNTHATQYQGSRFEYKSSPSVLSGGDFFLMDLSTNPFEGPDHARVIVGWGYVEEGDCIGCWRLLVNQHCVDRKRVRWDYNIPSGTLIWAWHVVW